MVFVNIDILKLLFGEVNVLLEYGVCNFNSFKEWGSVSLKLDAKCPKHISCGDSFTRVLGIKGANASGKTGLLKGISFVARFCANSFANKPGQQIAFDSFAGSTDPTRFYVEFQAGKATYLYELVVTDSEVISETIYRTKKKKQKILERSGNSITHSVKELQELAKMNLRPNVSIISSANQYQFHGLSEVYDFFSNMISNVGYSGVRDNMFNLSRTCELYYQHNSELIKVIEFLKDCDTGISKIEIAEIPDESEDKGKRYIPWFYHSSEGKDFFIAAHGESNGTVTMFKSLLMYHMILMTGGVLVLDEFDANLHPLLLPKLLDLFLDPSKNNKNAQLIVTSHSTEVLDYLGRYRTCLVTKRDNQSFVYRLDEISGDVIRNDRPMRPAYMEGKLGGVPRI